MTLVQTIRLARPNHWFKNIIVLFPVMFAMRYADRDAWIQAALATVAFCLVSAACYIINDIADRERDRLHPAKRDRPLAAGTVSVPVAVMEAVVLLAAGLLLARANGGWLTFFVVLTYVILQCAYTVVLKRKIIVDVICIALGFVLRAVGGAVAIDALISPWLIVCTFTICMFLGFCKRRNELATMGDVAHAESHRDTLGGYTPSLLTHLITLSAAIAVVSYLLYASSARTQQNLGTIYLVYTLPIVVYGVFRFAMLSMRGRYSDPVDIALHDWPVQLTAVLWMAAVSMILVWGSSVKAWLQEQG